jgi:alternate signal-mediated exported protein
MTRHTGSPRRARPRLIDRLKSGGAVVLAALLGFGVAAIGTTYALWADGNTAQIGTISTGVLDLEPGATQWKVVDTEGEVVTSGTTRESLADLVSPCGTGLRLKVDTAVTVALAGDNMSAELTVTWTGSGEPEGTYSVFDPNNDTLVGSLSTKTAPVATVGVGRIAGTYKVSVVYDLPQCDFWAGGAPVAYGGFSAKLDQKRGVTTP